MKKKSYQAAIPYIGSAKYCYADSVAMLLTSIGENISPGKIEVLSGVGLGACISEKTNLLFFSWGLPIYGINHSLNILGFSCKAKKVPKTKPAPLEKLKKDLEKSAAIIGPLDMGYLVYDPNYRFHQGFDHFVLAYKMDEQEIYLHDPAGFPYVSLKLEQFKLAWQAKKLDYGKDFYRYWTQPKRVGKPTKKAIYQRAIKFFQFVYQESEEKGAKKGRIVGREAILTVSQRLKTKKASQIEIEQLTYFALPLGAKRALDFAEFFDGSNKKLAALKRQQAELFGQCQTLAVRKDWPQLTKSLEQLARIEEQLRLTLTSSARL